LDHFPHNLEPAIEEMVKARFLTISFSEVTAIAQLLVLIAPTTSMRSFK
jgi:hypothetical protein